MADMIKIPGIGPVKKEYAITGGLVLVIVAGIAWYRSQGEPDADPIEQDSSVINPATGFPYGSAEDAYALAGQGFQYSGGIIGDSGPGGSSGGGGTPTSGAFVTNGQWSQAAEDYLVNTVGLEANLVGNALGKYITGTAMNPDQVTIVEQAIAFTGYPPVNGPTGYPPSYRTVNTPPPTAPPPATPVTPKAPVGLKVVAKTRSSVTLDWDPLPGIKGYQVYMSGRRQTTVTYSGRWTKQGLRPNSVYKFQVFGVYRLPGAKNDTRGPGSAVISVRTSK
jgi:hypothetical protein